MTMSANTTMADSTTKKRPTHPLLGAYQKKWTSEEQTTDYVAYLEKELLCKPCKSSNESITNRCNCLEDLGTDDPRVKNIVMFLCEFGCLKQQDRQTKAMEYIRQSENIKITTIGSKKRSFPLPVAGEATDPYFICRPAFQNIVNMSRLQWKSLASQCQANRMEAKGHHLNGRLGVKSNRSIDPELVAALYKYFEDVKKMGAPRATRIVRDELGGFGVRDDSSSVSKRGLHKRFCMSRGWTPVAELAK
jgi:hypothetical protein